MKHSLAFIAAFLLPQLTVAEPNLVPYTPSTAPDYFCTWNVQGFACSYSGASNQADVMTETSLFGKEPNQNWTEFYPDIRGDLTFLLDDAYDFPIGGGHNDPHRGSIELDAGRFPSYKGTPAQRLAQLTKAVKARGWRDLGLWICSSRPNVDALPVDSDAYWCQRLAWSQQAGVRNWKVDWGIGIPGAPLWKFKVTPKARRVAPDVWIEFGTQGDLYRTYDVNISVSIPETIRRICARPSRRWLSDGLQGGRRQGPETVRWPRPALRGDEREPDGAVHQVPPADLRERRRSLRRRRPLCLERCLYSRNVQNLFMAGRDISVTHEALGAVRVMRTGGMMGEIVGMAASLCKEHDCTPRDIYTKHLECLKRLMNRGVGKTSAKPET
jgi:hypothetical protein